MPPWLCVAPCGSGALDDLVLEDVAQVLAFTCHPRRSHPAEEDDQHHGETSNGVTVVQTSHLALPEDEEHTREHGERKAERPLG